MKPINILVCVLSCILGMVLIECNQSTNPPVQSPKPDVKMGAPSYPATELTQAEARTIALTDPSYSVIHYSQILHVIKVGKGIPMPDGSYSIDYNTLQHTDQIAPGTSDPSCDCDNGTHSWQCNCDPKHKILIVGVPDCCTGYCGQFGILIWCWGGCDSKAETCSDAFAP